jgi:hypothetical protein
VTAGATKPQRRHGAPHHNTPQRRPTPQHTTNTRCTLQVALARENTAIPAAAQVNWGGGGGWRWEWGGGGAGQVARWNRVMGAGHARAPARARAHTAPHPCHDGCLLPQRRHLLGGEVTGVEHFHGKQLAVAALAATVHVGIRALPNQVQHLILGLESATALQATAAGPHAPQHHTQQKCFEHASGAGRVGGVRRRAGVGPAE